MYAQKSIRTYVLHLFVWHDYLQYRLSTVHTASVRVTPINTVFIGVTLDLTIYRQCSINIACECIGHLRYLTHQRYWFVRHDSMRYGNTVIHRKRATDSCNMSPFGNCSWDMTIPHMPYSFVFASKCGISSRDTYMPYLLVWHDFARTCRMTLRVHAAWLCAYMPHAYDITISHTTTHYN